MKRILAGIAVVLVVSGFLFVTLGASSPPSGTTYRIELDNSFGLVTGGDFKVAGVRVGTVKKIDLCYSDSTAHCQNPLHALITVNVSERGFGQFHTSVFCQSRPQSLIGEYFIDCEPGTQGAVIPAGSTIPADHTQSTIPADLVQNIMRLPYRQRFTILINELGAAVAARSEDLQTALRRADPALAETDNLLNLLANDAHIIQQLNVNADQVITALAKGAPDVQRFVVEGNNAASESATQAQNITLTWQKLPAFLEQLRPALAKLGAASDAQDPVLVNLNAAASNLNRFFTDLVPFSHESVPSLRSLGQASQVGIPAVQAATPTVRDLNRFAKPTPELAQNLGIVLHDLDDRGRAVEPDLRSPGGKGYSGLEALLQYVFNITNAVSYFSTWGHLLGVDGYIDNTCSPYATPQTIANNIASYLKNGGDLNQPGPAGNPNPRSCYAFLGPNQPGVTEPDPTFSQAVANSHIANPGQPAPVSTPGMANGTNGCVPDPGGYPIEPNPLPGSGYPASYGVHYHGTQTNACKLAAASSPASDQSSSKLTRVTSRVPVRPSRAGPGGSTSSPGQTAAHPVNTVGQTVGGIVSGLVGTLTGQLPNAPVKVGGSGGPATGSPASGASNSAKQLLNYLLAP
jgi:ABC-type transporter Mla subunit MlaD